MLAIFFSSLISFCMQFCWFLVSCDFYFVSNCINQYSDHSRVAQTLNKFWELGVLSTAMDTGWEFGIAGVRAYFLFWSYA